MLEKLVHTGRQIPKHQVCVTFDYPDDLRVTTVNPDSLREWQATDMSASRRFGDEWLGTARTAILLVPSVVFDIERNALINPMHADFVRIRVLSVAPVRWDDRLFTVPKR